MEQNEAEKETNVNKDLIIVMDEFSKVFKPATTGEATIFLSTTEVCEKIRDFYPGEFFNNEVYNELKSRGYEFKPIGEHDINFFWLFKK